MSDAVESAPVDAPVAAPRRWIRPKWAIFWSLVLFVVVGPLVVRQYRVSQVPVISEPIDVQKFVERYHIPDSENASVEYKEAVAKLVENPDWQESLQPENITGFKWENSPNEVKEAVKANEAALELWMQGTKKPHYVDVPPDQLKIDTLLEVAQKIRGLARVAVWKQIKLQDEGQLDDSWEIIVAGQRLSIHLMGGTTMIERLVGIAMHAVFSPQLSRWSEDPDVTVEQLRSALADLQERRKSVPPVSDSIKADYFVYRKPSATLRRAMNFTPAVQPPRNLQTRFIQFLQGPLTDFGYQVIGEYELSERFLRHLFSNWIKSVDLPPHERDALVLTSAPFLVFRNQPQGDEVLSAEKLVEVEQQLIFFRGLIPVTSHLLSACDRDRFRWSVEELVLALQIYYRIHQEFPEDLKLLVPEVLEKLPENPYGDELDASFRYRVESDHVVIWSAGEYEPVPLEEGPVYVVSPNGRSQPAAFYFTIYPPGTRAPLYRPYPPGFEEELKKREEAKKSQQPGGAPVRFAR